MRSEWFQTIPWHYLALIIASQYLDEFGLYEMALGIYINWPYMRD